MLTILLPPRMKMVTALVFLHSWITSMRSFVVPKEISFTKPAVPSFSGVSSQNLGTMRPPVAMAINCRENTTDTVHLNKYLGSFVLCTFCSPPPCGQKMLTDQSEKAKNICSSINFDKGVASCDMSITSISGPPTQRTAGSSFCSRRWLASSSKPHWQMAKLAPLFLT